MKRAYLLMSLALAGCGGPATSLNPKELWLAPAGSEKADQLIAQEPQPF